MTKVPNLRFNNFNDAWKEHVLGDIFEFYTTNSFSRDFLDNDNGSVKNIHYGDIHMKFPTILDVKNKQIPYIKETVDLSKISIEAYCKNGDVVIADASEDYNDIGKAIELKNVGEEKLLAGLHTILARDNKQIMVNGFRGYLMSSPNVRKQIKVYAAGAKVLGISKANISKVSLLIPSSTEQEKIASFFSLIDKKIELQTEKVEELKNYKKGIMQKIFSQELRFKDENGNEYPEWEEKKLEDFCDFCGGGTPQKQNTEFWQGDIPWVSSSDIKENSINHINITRYITNDAVKNSATKICPSNSVLIVSRVGIGKVALSPTEICTSQDFTNIINTSSNKKYLAYIISERMKREAQQSQGTSIKGITSNEIKSMKFFIPEIKEQEKIASFFSLMDRKIDLEIDKLKQLQFQKKALSQQMFI